jgi:PAS domain S-box-containing protein
MSVPLPPDEDARLAALHQYAILDTAPEGAFDDLTHLAASICKMPIALIGLVDAERQWFKSRVGVDAPEVPREIAFCAHTILQPDVLIVPDLQSDKRFATNPLVTDDPHARFYAGVPLTTPAGQALGTLCVIDRVPRDLSAGQVEALRALSRQIMAQLELRRHVAELHRSVTEIQRAQADMAATHVLLNTIIENLPHMIFVKDAEHLRFVRFNQAGEELLGYPREALLGKNDYDFFPEEEAAFFISKDRAVLETGQQLDIPEELIQTKEKGVRILHTKKVPIPDADGRPQYLLGISEDITERKRAEQEHQQLQETIMENQVAMLTEMSTPLIPVSDQIVVMPLIGTVDPQRVQQVLDTLLHGIAEHRAEIAILDITGVVGVDTQVAHGLVRVAQTAQLLGAQVMLTGVRPEIAQTLVGLGTELRGVITRKTLKDGITYAIDQRGIRSRDIRTDAAAKEARTRPEIKLA